jgi:hypothetical protein
MSLEHLQREMRRIGKGLKSMLKEALRCGLLMAGKPVRPPRFEVRPQAFGFKPGIDLDRMNQLADDLEVGEAARRLRR